MYVNGDENEVFGGCASVGEVSEGCLNITQKLSTNETEIRYSLTRIPLDKIKKVVTTVLRNSIEDRG